METKKHALLAGTENWGLQLSRQFTEIIEEISFLSDEIKIRTNGINVSDETILRIVQESNLCASKIREKIENNNATELDVKKALTDIYGHVGQIYNAASNVCENNAKKLAQEAAAFNFLKLKILTVKENYDVLCREVQQYKKVFHDLNQKAKEIHNEDLVTALTVSAGNTWDYNRLKATINKVIDDFLKDWPDLARYKQQLIKSAYTKIKKKFPPRRNSLEENGSYLNIPKSMIRDACVTAENLFVKQLAVNIGLLDENGNQTVRTLMKYKDSKTVRPQVVKEFEQWLVDSGMSPASAREYGRKIIDISEKIGVDLEELEELEDLPELSGGKKSIAKKFLLFKNYRKNNDEKIIGISEKIGVDIDSKKPENLFDLSERREESKNKDSKSRCSIRTCVYSKKENWNNRCSLGLKHHGGSCDYYEPKEKASCLPKWYKLGS